MEARGAPNGERKTITALFADMAGFTAFAKDLDPEDTRHIVDPALQLMMDAVHRYEGYVAQSLGDGIFALFGAPIAHEDHPQRALYAALLMQDEMRRYADRIRLEKGVPLQMRVGVNTGEVVLRSIRKDDLHTDYVPVGHSTNLASRMEGLAMPGSIVVSDNTYKLIKATSSAKPWVRRRSKESTRRWIFTRCSVLVPCARNCKLPHAEVSRALSVGRVNLNRCSALGSRPKSGMGRLLRWWGRQGSANPGSFTNL